MACNYGVAVTNKPSEDWRSLDPEALVAQFMPRIAVPDAQEYLDSWALRSAELARSFPGNYDLRYGKGPKMTFDLHVATDPSAPLIVFIHGGYWRALDKADHVFAARGLHHSGFSVANLNYDLCPAVSLLELNRQIGRAVRHICNQAPVWGVAAAPVYIMGHSAGAHAAALAAADPELPDAVAGIIAVSGIFDTNVVPHLPINEEVRLTAADAAVLNLMNRPPRFHLRALVVVGGLEPPAWIGQSTAWHRRASGHLADCRLDIVAGTHHFSVLEACCDPDHAAGRMMADFLGRPSK